MKKNFLILASIVFLFSCDKKEKYQGKWTNSYLKPSYYYNEAKSIVIENDSIKFNYTYFDFWNKYPLKIEKEKFKFNNITISALVEEDTLTLNDSIYLLKNYHDTLYWVKPLLKIDLPKVSELTKTTKKNNDLINYVYYGKRLDNGKPCLQLNDKYAEINELPEFLSYSRGSRREELTPFHSTFLFIDKTIPMKFIEDIFYNLKIVNQLKVCFINNIHLMYNDSIGFYYNYEKLTKKLPPFREDDNYSTNTSTSSYNIPPTLLFYYPFFDDFTPKAKFILLKKDKIYYNNKTINLSDLKPLIKPWVKNNDVIFSLYDLQSTYGSFLEMNAIINSVYNEARKNQALLKFNKKLHQLSREEMTEIKMKIRMYHTWSFSIPHYNTIVENNNSFFGLEVNSIN
ncbi:hypothetical protein [Flavivirga eckloniae]|uniref:Lipoprotein n=1 Tax=Flavivirga eckloniae TaxID=1803846 RepID=A0A2K9PQ90_9FLAO|nr:hypothetical protein [Flavivirga eckloniae]AUP79209.1 hypothetical protein C1H87_11040 [Flavivirga eckloniae]